MRAELGVRTVDIKTTMQEGVQILSVSGKIDGMASAELETILTELLDKGEQKLIVDMKDVYYLSSSGLRVILVATKRLHEKGKIVLTRLQQDVREIFEMTGFDTIVPIHDELDTAKEEMRSI
jgi:anti-anti-sigma factor